MPVCAMKFSILARVQQPGNATAVTEVGVSGVGVTEGTVTGDEVIGDVTNEPTKSVMTTEAREESFLSLQKNSRKDALCPTAYITLALRSRLAHKNHTKDNAVVCFEADLHSCTPQYYIVPLI